MAIEYKCQTCKRIFKGRTHRDADIKFEAHPCCIAASKMTLKQLETKLGIKKK